MHEAWPTSHGRNQSARLRRKILDLRRKTMAGELRLLGSPPLAQRSLRDRRRGPSKKTPRKYLLQSVFRQSKK